MIHTRATKFISKATPLIKSWCLGLFVVNTTSYIFSAPILLWWGLPLSALSFVGNIVFAPVLALFIVLCAILMSASLLGFSCTWIAIPLEWLTTWWMSLLKLGSKHFLYAQIAHPVIIAVSIAIVIGTGKAALESKTTKMLVTSLAFGSLFMTLLFMLPLTNSESTLSNKNGELRITQTTSHFVTIEDSGFFKGLKTPAKGIAFNVRRPIIQNHGTLHVKKLSTNQISTRTFESIAELIISMEVSEITLPYIEPPQTPSVWRSLSRVRKLAKESGVKIRYTKKDAPRPAT